MGRMLVVGSVGFLSVICMACYREATIADCQLIIDRMAELGLREHAKSLDPESVKKKQAEFRKELEGTMKIECIGRRISEATMTCVRNADTQAKLNACLR